MNVMRPVTIWMNMPSFYQNDLFAELAKKVDLRVVYDHGLTDDRLLLGWREPTAEYCSSTLDRDRKLRHAIAIAQSEKNRVHVINGMWAEPAFMMATLVLGSTGTPFAIYAECPDHTISRSGLRRGARAVVGHWVSRQASGLFAVSHFARDYFGKFGVQEQHIYPFGYFRNAVAPRMAPDSDNVSIVYIGQLVRRKGIDILLNAMAPLWPRFPGMRLRLVGVGPELASIVAKVQRDRLEGRVVLEGARSSSHIHELLARASLLILPSRWDGWGLVISEALSAGVPVIASDRCGAADLIVHGVNGYIFRSEDVESLRSVLSAFLSSDEGQMRAAAMRTGSALTIPLAAAYFVECLEHMCGCRADKPTPPWEEVLRRVGAESQNRGSNDSETLPDMKTTAWKSA